VNTWNFWCQERLPKFQTSPLAEKTQPTQQALGSFFKFAALSNSCRPLSLVFQRRSRNTGASSPADKGDSTGSSQPRRWHMRRCLDSATHCSCPHSQNHQTSLEGGRVWWDWCGEPTSCRDLEESPGSRKCLRNQWFQTKQSIRLFDCGEINFVARIVTNLHPERLLNFSLFGLHLRKHAKNLFVPTKVQTQTFRFDTAFDLCLFLPLLLLLLLFVCFKLKFNQGKWDMATWSGVRLGVSWPVCCEKKKVKLPWSQPHQRTGLFPTAMAKTRESKELPWIEK